MTNGCRIPKRKSPSLVTSLVTQFVTGVNTRSNSRPQTVSKILPHEQQNRNNESYTTVHASGVDSASTKKISTRNISWG